MMLADLVSALLSYDTLAARQWVADAHREGLSWSDVPAPQGFDSNGMVVAASMVELLAERAGQPAPQWTKTIPSAQEPILLLRPLERDA